MPVLLKKKKKAKDLKNIEESVIFLNSLQVRLQQALRHDEDCVTVASDWSLSLVL